MIYNFLFWNLVNAEQLRFPLPHKGFIKEKDNEEDKLSNIMKCDKQLARTTTFSLEVYDRIYKQVADSYYDLSEECDGVHCDRTDFAGCIIRLAAHDFLDTARAAVKTTKGERLQDMVPGETNVGGMDGCISMTTGENKGLIECLKDSPLP